MSVKQVLHTLTDRIATSANVKMVYGDPIEAGGKTIIPVAKISGGFGAGGSSSGNDDASEKSGGGGGGGGFRAIPIGVVEVTPERTQFVPIWNTKSLLVGAAAGLILAALLRRR